MAMRDRLSQDDLENLLDDSRWESAWRAESDRAAAYYDGLQLEPDVVQAMRDRGQAPVIRNLVAVSVDSVLGMEAKTRRDWRATADKDEDVEVAEAMSAKLKQAERTSSADRACSDAFADMVKSGLGWVEIARESNPFKAPYRVRAIHRNEIFWDFRAKEPDLSDARYVVRKQWIDEDVASLYFPKNKALFSKLISRWADWDNLSTEDDGVDLIGAHGNELRSSLPVEEWLDSGRKRVLIYEVWYKHWVTRPVLLLPSGQSMEYDANNPAHAEAIAMGMAQVNKAVFPKVRLAWFAGPHKISDIPSPYPHGFFPYVPFWGFREDSTRVPYGLVRRMMSPQDEVNARLSRMIWLLSAKRIIADTDAADQPWAEIAEEAARPDAVILMNPNRKNKNSDALRIESDFQLSQQQFNVLQDATRAIQDASGVQMNMLGKSEYAGQSGLAISSLVEQSSTTLAELNDNFRYARRLVGTVLMSLVKEDIGSAPYPVVVETNGHRRTVMLNQPTQDEDGLAYLTNDVSNTLMRIELEDVPDTPSFRAQQFSMMVELAKSLPPEIQPLFAGFMVRASDLPFRHELADKIDKQLGIGADGEQDPNAQQDPAMMQQQMEMQQQQQMFELQMQEQQAKNAKAAADAQKAQVAVQNEQTKMADSQAKQQMMQQKMMHAEDDHAQSMDEAALAQVQSLEQHSQKQQEAQLKGFQQVKQQDEAHKMTMSAAQLKNKQAQQAHQAKLKQMNKPKPKAKSSK